MQLKNYQEILEILQSTKLNIYLWGCSVITGQSIKELENLNLVINGIIDNNYEEESYCNIPVFSPLHLQDLNNSIVFIQGNHCLSIYKQLQLYDLSNITILFDYDNGGSRLQQIINANSLYFVLNNFPENTSLIDIFLSKSKDIPLESYTYINKLLDNGNFLINFMNIKNQYSDNKELQAVFENYLKEYINKKISTNFLYIGCGEDYRDTYLHSDLRVLSHVDIVCNAWELSNHILGLEKIYTRHMLEHLTQKEAYLTLLDWYKSLRNNGELEIIVPNFDLRAQQWLDSKWENMESRTHDEIWSVAGCWGWQRECDPLQENYNQTYWDVHKSGYNEKRITMLLTQVGFKDINTRVDEKNNLIAFAYKK